MEHGVKIDRKSQVLGLVLIGIYIIVRMVADPYFWRNISEWYSYGFEAVFILASWFLFRKDITIWTRPLKGDFAGVLVAVASGALVYRVASWIHVTIPFDLSAGLTIFFLLVLAPILEELIFRFALWQAFTALFKRAWIIVLATTFLFVAGHFSAYWFVPSEFHGFVIYQTTYVALLGLATGWARLKSGAVVASVLIHFGFNLGFYLGSFIH